MQNLVLFVACPVNMRLQEENYWAHNSVFIIKGKLLSKNDGVNTTRSCTLSVGYAMENVYNTNCTNGPAFSAN